MNTSTTLFLFNEHGIVADNHQLDIFCHKLMYTTVFDFKVLNKEDIDLQSTVFRKFTTETLECTIFDRGYVMKIEGTIWQAIQLLVEIDSVLKKDILIYVSPSQRVENLEENKFPRGTTRRNIAAFLDLLFSNQDYTTALSTANHHRH